MFDRFTERARKAMTLARQEAQGLRHDYIDVEHILLGLCRDPSSVAAHALAGLDVDPGDLHGFVRAVLSPGKASTSGAQLPFTPRAKRTLEFALEEAQGLGHTYIGTEHLLLGVLRTGGGAHAAFLDSFGLYAERVRGEVRSLLRAGASPAAPAMPRLTFGEFLEWARRSMTSPPETADLDAAIDGKYRALHAAWQEGDEAGVEGIRADIAGLEGTLESRLGRWKADAARSLREFLQREREHRGVRIGPARRVFDPGPASAPDPLGSCFGTAATSLCRPFSDAARAAMLSVRREALELANDYVGTEHLLLGLLRGTEGVAARVLAEAGLDRERVLAEVRRLVEPETREPAPTGPLPLSPRAKRVLEAAGEEARGLGAEAPGTGHLLLGLLGETDGPAAHVLSNLEVRAEVLHYRVLERLGREPPEPRTAPRPAPGPPEDDPGEPPPLPGARWGRAVAWLFLGGMLLAALWLLLGR